jgi:hypothetical protein
MRLISSWRRPSRQSRVTAGLRQSRVTAGLRQSRVAAGSWQSRVTAGSWQSRVATASRRGRVAAALACAIMLAPATGDADGSAAGGADAFRESSLFDLYFGGIWAGTVDLRLEYDANGYRAEAEGRSEGLVGALYGASFNAVAHGKAPGALGPAPGGRPAQFRAFGSFGGDEQSLTITYGLLGPQAISADPPYKPKPWQIDPFAQTGVVDPLGAAALLLRARADGALCAAGIDVFDGRRRYRVTLSAPRAGAVADEIQCDAALARVAGWRPKDMGKPPFDFRLFFTRQAGETPARLARFEVDTGYGMATAVRRR